MSDLNRLQKLLDQQHKMMEPYQRRLDAWFARNMKDIPQIPVEVLRSADEALNRYKAAVNSPKDDVRKAWRHLGEMTLRESYDHIGYLPDPFTRDRGRPLGSGRRSLLIAELDRRVKRGEVPTTAARKIYEEQGVVAGLKAKADSLVKAWTATMKSVK